MGCCLWGRRVGHDRNDLAAAAAATMLERFSKFLTGPVCRKTRKATTKSVAKDQFPAE